MSTAVATLWLLLAAKPAPRPGPPPAQPQRAAPLEAPPLVQAPTPEPPLLKHVWISAGPGPALFSQGQAGPAFVARGSFELPRLTDRVSFQTSLPVSLIYLSWGIPALSARLPTATLILPLSVYPMALQKAIPLSSRLPGPRCCPLRCSVLLPK
jgi:hypothetical protein